MGDRAGLAVTDPQRSQRTEEPRSAPDASGGASGASEPETIRVDSLPEPTRARVAEKREGIRGLIAGALTVLFVAMVVAVFVSAVVGGGQWDRVQEFVQITFGFVAGLVGGAVGFYFGSQR